MHKRAHITLEAALLTALLALLGLSLLANPTYDAEQVVITGWLHVEDSRVDDVLLVVEVDGVLCQPALVQGNGRFVIGLPAGSKATLQFSKPGHLPKEVLVDTRNALNTPQARRANRRVKFDVVLEPERARPGHAYAGPVGSIGFVNGTGTMRVRHHKRFAPTLNAQGVEQENAGQASGAH